MKSIRDFLTIHKNPIIGPHFETYEYYFVYGKHLEVNIWNKDYYSAIFSSTNINQWISNIAIGLLENIFIEYAIEIPICTWLSLYPLHIHISIGTIIGTIECLYKHIKKDDDNKNIKNDDDNKNIKNDDSNKNIKNDYDIGLLKSFYFLFFLNSICVFKINL